MAYSESTSSSSASESTPFSSRANVQFVENLHLITTRYFQVKINDTLEMVRRQRDHKNNVYRWQMRYREINGQYLNLPRHIQDELEQQYASNRVDF